LKEIKDMDLTQLCKLFDSLDIYIPFELIKKGSSLDIDSNCEVLRNWLAKITEVASEEPRKTSVIIRLSEKLSQFSNAGVHSIPTMKLLLSLALLLNFYKNNKNLRGSSMMMHDEKWRFAVEIYREFILYYYSISEIATLNQYHAGNMSDEEYRFRLDKIVEIDYFKLSDEEIKSAVNCITRKDLIEIFKCIDCRKVLKFLSLDYRSYNYNY
jgi:hypothetical protein